MYDSQSENGKKKAKWRRRGAKCTVSALLKKWRAFVLKKKQAVFHRGKGSAFPSFVCG